MSFLNTLLNTAISTSLTPSLRRWAQAFGAIGFAVAVSAAHAAPEVVRIGVATAGGGDPVTWGGSPGGVARSQTGWRRNSKARASRSSGCSSKARARP